MSCIGISIYNVAGALADGLDLLRSHAPSSWPRAASGEILRARRPLELPGGLTG